MLRRRGGRGCNHRDVAYGLTFFFFFFSCSAGRDVPLKLLTKGDNNLADDTELYARGQDYLSRSDVIGSVIGYVPFVGYVTIMLSEHPWMKKVLLGLMGVMVVLQRE